MRPQGLYKVFLRKNAQSGTTKLAGSSRAAYARLITTGDSFL
jgi:hypothetical protein